MGSIKSLLIATACFSLLGFSVYSAEQKTPGANSNIKSDVVLPIDEVDWAVYMDAPNYHFALAKEYVQKGDFVKAASELKLGNSFLLFQKNRLTAASKEIDALSTKLATGKDKKISDIDFITANALNVINNKYSMAPVEVDATSVFEDAYKYHFDKAKTLLQGGDNAGAASEIKRGAAFLKLKASQTGRLAKTELDAVVNELNTFVSKVESGSVKDVKELEQELHKAISAISKK